MVAALGHASVPYRADRPSGRRRLRHPARPGRGRARSWPRSGRPGGRPPASRCTSSPTWWCSSAPDAARRAPAGPGWTSGPGHEYTSDAAIFAGTARQLADLLLDWRQAGLSGFRLRPGVIPDDLEAITRDLVPELQRRGVFRTAYEAGTLRGLLGLTAPPTATPPPGGANLTRLTKQIHLAAHFPGVNNTTVWSDPRSGSHIEFSSFAHLAQTAERAKFDFLFLAEGLRLREQSGRSTTSTWSGGRTPSPCWPRWPR